MNASNTRMVSDKRLQQALDIASDAIVVSDRAGVIRDCNAHALKMFGYEHEALIGQSVDILIPPWKRGAHKAFRSGYVANMTDRPMGEGRVLSVFTRDGNEIQMDTGLTTLQTEKGTFILATMRDANFC